MNNYRDHGPDFDTESLHHQTAELVLLYFLSDTPVMNKPKTASRLISRKSHPFPKYISWDHGPRHVSEQDNSI